MNEGRDNSFLVIYITESGFFVDPITIEIVRRELGGRPPRFERIYYLSCFDMKEGGVSEIFPGKSHHFFGDWADEALQRPAYFPHPLEMQEVSEVSTLTCLAYYGDAGFKIRYSIPLGLKSES